MKKMVNILILIMVILGIRFVAQNYARSKGAPTGTSINKEAVKVENANVGIIIMTTKGDINIKFFPEVAPMTVTNMMTLAKNGYYDNIKFHRVIKDFMIQGGDPTGTGAGGPGYNFKDEVSREYKFDRPGILAMANAGPGTNGSQFFITHVPTDWLNMKHTIFGEVVSTEDQNVVNKIAQGDLILGMKLTGDYEEFLNYQKELVESIEGMIKK